MNPTTRLFDQRTNIGGTAVAGNVEVAIPVASSLRKIKLHSILVKRKTGASVTNMQPRIYDVSGAAASATSERYRGAATAPGTLFHVTSIDRPTYTTTNGYIYLIVDGDAADTFEYELWYEVLS